MEDIEASFQPFVLGACAFAKFRKDHSPILSRGSDTPRPGLRGSPEENLHGDQYRRQVSGKERHQQSPRKGSMTTE